MRVLGLGCEGDSGAAVVEDGRILAAINEERLARIKLVVGFPRASIREVLRLTGTRTDRLSAVLVGGVDDLFVDGLRPYEGWFEYRPTGLGGLLKRAAGRFSPYRSRLPLLETAYYALLSPSFRRRRRRIRALVRSELGVACPIHFVDHHFAHITSAYYTSGFGDALVVSIDGGGDAKSAVVYAVRGGRFERLQETSAFDSLGNYYAYVTQICGFEAMRHEGKVTGLAAHGEPRYVPLLREFIDEVNGTFVNLGQVAFTAAIDRLCRRLPPGWTREDLAASIQRHFEEVVCRFVAHWARRTGFSDVAVAGGVFANVRVNQEVHALPGVRRLHVHPAMSDAGLAVGAALAACAPGVLAQPMPSAPEPLRDVYLGPPITERQVEAALREHDLQPQSVRGELEAEIAALLANGYVVARAAGRLEYGPRALGNRSILYQPADPDVNHWLNRNLRRTEFMPFAPAVLEEARDRCFHDTEGAEHAAEFMTITFRCTSWARAHLPGVVHIDGTARPQVVRRDRNPRFHRIIDAFRAHTRLPAVINTSFNMHEEPIVCSAHDAVRAFLEGKLDYLALGGRLVRHPRPVRRPLKPVVAATGSQPA